MSTAVATPSAAAGTQPLSRRHTTDSTLSTEPAGVPEGWIRNEIPKTLGFYIDPQDLLRMLRGKFRQVLSDEHFHLNIRNQIWVYYTPSKVEDADVLRLARPRAMDRRRNRPRVDSMPT